VVTIRRRNRHRTVKTGAHRSIAWMMLASSSPLPPSRPAARPPQFAERIA
jgi:hypothetical protein